MYVCGCVTGREIWSRARERVLSPAPAVCLRGTQGLMGALSSFILIAALGDLSVTLATVATGQKEVF